MSNPSRLHRVCPNTIDGKDVRIRDNEAVTSFIPLLPNERILYFYLYSDAFESNYIISEQICVCLTNERIFKLEKGNLDNVLISDLLRVKYQNNGIFSWDKIEMDLIDGKTETIGISPAETCRFFCNSLIQLLNKHQRDREERIDPIPPIADGPVVSSADPVVAPLNPRQQFFG